MRKLGRELKDDEIEQVFNQHDVTHDGKISFEEFKHMFLPDERWIHQMNDEENGNVANSPEENGFPE